MKVDRQFWAAVSAVIAADDEGDDVVAVAEDLLENRPVLAEQLQASVQALDAGALARALDLSDGGPPSEDALLAVGCAVLAEGPETYTRAIEDPESLVREWDLGRGDLLLALNPATTLDDSGPRRRAGTAAISISLGGSTLPGIRRVNDALSSREGRTQVAQTRWRHLFETRHIEDLYVHLEARPGAVRRVGRARRTLPGMVEVVVAWEAPKRATEIPALLREVMDAVHDTVECSGALQRPPVVEQPNARAWEVLLTVLRNVDFGLDPPKRIVGAWVADEVTICIVYEKEGCPTIGLRRELEPGVPAVRLAEYIAHSELGEPLGTLWNEAVADEHGVHWFSGDHPEWRYY